MHNFKYIIVFFCIFSFIFGNTVVLSATGDAVYVWSQNSSENTVLTTSEPVKENSLSLESGSAILIEQTTGQILYEHNIHEQLRPASVTKIMSILLIMEALDNGIISLDTPIPCSENAAKRGGSQIWLDTTETLSVNDMLKAICVVSANDCVVAMAEYLGVSEEGFVEQMNNRAKELGMNDTIFKNCHGIDEDGHVTSSYDIALMSRELLQKHPQITDYTTIYMDSLRDGKSELVNTNKLIRNYKGATGLKTGSTSLTLYNLSASATRDNLSLIAVIMKAPTTKTRFSEAQKLLDYGFNNYTCKSFGNEGETVQEVTVNKGVEKTVNAIFKNSANVFIKKGQENNIIQNITIDENIFAPIEKDQKIGEVTYTLDNETIANVDLIADNEVKKINFWNMTTHLYELWFNVTRNNK